ncbi:PucR family transcriptional regulator [Streptomyces sp. NPDC056341]|uniref:PucR family transcriptional regulator n=1 Tax=Streptomyces sp. NPDC056341 TaxID=3345788 RepID=UPI0035DA4983
MSDRTNPDGRAAGSLRFLVGSAGPLRVLTAPGGLDVSVRGTVIHDPGDPLPAAPSALLLLVGADVADPRTGTVLRRAAAEGYAGVVVKCRGQEADRLTAEAERCSLAVLAAGDAVPWRYVDAEIGCALAAYGVGDLSPSAPAGSEELFSLADAVAAVVGGSVAVEDLDQHVVAYSNVPGQRIDSLRERGILERRVPDDPGQRQQYRDVLAADGVVRFPRARDELARAAVAVRAGTLPLGTLWAIEPEGGLSEQAESALRDAARLAAPHLLRALNATEAEQRMRRDTLRALLEGYGPPADEAAARLGLGQGEKVCLAAFAPDEGGALIAHLESSLVRYCAAHLPSATVTASARAVYVLVTSLSPAAARRFADGALGTVRAALGTPVRAVVTRAYPDLLRAGALRREADDILRATDGDGGGAPAATAEDVRHVVLLNRLADELRREPWLRLPGVAALLAHDAEQGTDYAATVTAWLDATGDVASAAAGLRVHPNTLRYRLRRVRELFGLDLDDREVRLAAWLELRLAQR